MSAWEIKPQSSEEGVIAVYGGGEGRSLSVAVGHNQSFFTFRRGAGGNELITGWIFLLIAQLALGIFHVRS